MVTYNGKYFKIPNTVCIILAEKIQEDKKKKWCLIALLVIAAILCVIALGLWIALAMLLYGKLAMYVRTQLLLHHNS